MVTCQFCGAENEAWYVYCQNCGKMIAAKKPAVPAPEPRPPAAPPGNGLTPGFKISSRPTEINEALLEDILPEQSTMVLQDADLPRDLAAGSAAAEAPPQPAASRPSAERPLGASAVAEGHVECSGCHRQVPRAHSLCGYCGVRIGDAPVPAGRPTVETLPPAASPAPADASQLMLMRVREDGSFDCGLRLKEGEVLLGRESGDLSFPSDSLMSRHHARIVAEGGRINLEDLGSTNGTFLRLKNKKPLESGDYLLIGKQLLRFEVDAPGTGAAPASANQTLVLGSLIGNYDARLVKRLPNGKDSNEYPLTEPVTNIGREKGEIIFKNDPFVSGRHARVLMESGCYTVEDLNSSNGTYLRLRRREEIGPGDFFIVGEQLFQVRLTGK